MSKIKSLLAFAALLLCGGAWAAIKPVAVWQAGTIDTMQGGTVNFNIAENASDTKGNTRNNDGSVTIVKRPIQVTLDADKAFSVNNGYTILVKYSGFVSGTAKQTLAAARIDSDDLIGLYTLNTTGTLAGIWNNGTWSTTTGGSGVIPSSGTFALAAKSGTCCYAMTDDSATEYYNNSSLWGSNRTFYGAVIGGMTSHATADTANNSLVPMTGLTVSGIAIFEDKASTEDLQNFVWPSDEIKYSATISSGESNWANLGWDTTWQNNVNVSVAKIKVTGDSTLNIAAAVSAKRVEIDIDENVTLSMKGNNAITTFDNIYITGKGSIKFDDNANGFTMIGSTSPKMNLGADATMVMYKAGQWNYSGVNFQNISGTGAIRLEGTDWQYVSSAANIWSTNHDTIINLANGMIIQAGSYTIANLSGSGTIRTDWGGSANDRSLTTYQTKNTTWSGKIYKDDTSRFNTFTVTGAGEAKTLTFTGTSTTQAGALTVDASGSMEMNGSWKAKSAVAINGEFGGSGSITGNGTITVGVGAKIRADWSGANGPVTLFTAPTMGALVDVVATEVPAGNKIKLFNGTFTASNTTTHARIFVGDDVHYGTVSIESDGVYATVSDEATTTAMDAAAKYKYEMNGSFENSSSSGVNLTVGGSFVAGDFRDNQVLKLNSNVGSHWGSAGFAYGSGPWTIVTAVKAPAANNCVFGVGGAKTVAGMLGLRNAGSNTMKLFTANATDLCGVTLNVDPTAAFHVYTIVYQDGAIKMNVDGGAFCEAVPFTPGTGTGWQMGGIVSGGNDNHSVNATSGEMDCFRMYSFPFVKADSYAVTTEFICKAEFDGKKYVTLADAIAAAGDENLDQITNIAADAVVPQGYRVKGGKVVTTADYYSRWTDTASAAAIIDLKSTASFYNSDFTVFYPATDTESDGFNGNTTGTPPFGGLSSMRYPWQIFASKINNDRNSAYIAPGVALRFTGDVTGKLMDASFAPLSFAGLIVEPGATGFGYKSWHATSDRHTEVGCTGYITHSYIGEDFEIYRAHSGTTKGLTFKGTHVLEIESQKIFHINDATKDNNNYADAQYKTTVEEGGCLKLVGAGTLSVSTLNAAGATIDLSAIGSTETAFITGSITVDASTKVYFPADWTAGTAMKLCSGAITGVETSGEVDVKIGEKTEHVILSYNSANGTVSYAYAPTAQTWDNGTIIFDGDLHHLTPVSEDVYTKTINDVTYTINLNGHELVTENGKSYILINEDANDDQLGVTVSREATNNTGLTMVIKYADYGYVEGTTKPIPFTINDHTYGNTVAPYIVNEAGAMKAGWANFHNNVEHAAASGKFDNSVETGWLAMSYGSSGARVYQLDDADWTEAYNANIYGGGTYNIDGVSVGGLFKKAANNSNGNSAVVAAGMKVYALAIATTPITSTTDTKLTSLVWPSEANAEAKIGKTLFDTVEEAITAATTGANKTVSLNKDIAAGAAIEIPEGVTLDIKGHNLNRAVTGSGVLIINKNITRTSTQSEDNDVNLPSALTTSLKDANNWHGEVVLVGGFDNVQMNPLFNLCNSSSKLTSKGNKGWLLQNSLENIKLNLVDNGATPALYISNSSYQWKYKAKLAGEGTIKVDSTSGTPTAALLVTDAEDFCGNIHMTDLSLYFGDDGAVLGNGLIKINGGVEMKVYPDKIWHAGPGGIEVAGTIKGSGTLEGTISFDAGSTLDLTDGMLTATTATAAGAFTVKVSNLDEFLAGEKKVMTLSAGGNTISAAQVTVTDGTNNAPTTYVLKATPTAAVLVAPESHTWTGATDGSINNAANWGADEMFSGDNQFVVFPAVATTKTVSVSDITLGKITINGAYSFTGKGTITLSELEFGNEGSLVLGTGTTLKFPGALNKSLLSKITFAGGTYAFENLPAFTASDIFSVDATNLAPDSYVLASWTGKMALNQSGYGKPTVNVIGLPSAYSTRVVCLVGKLYVQIIDTAAQAKKKTYKVWAVGDSITEGYNSNSTCANYRTQLAAKLALAGYNIEMVGYYDHRNKMPSGEDAPAEWSFHSGVSGQRIWTRSSTGQNSTHAGYIDAIDAALFQVGTDVDVVTVLLGTNDLGNGNDTAQHAFDGWKIVVKKILDGCPNAKVVVSPLIDMHSASGSGKRASYNQLITNGITEANFGSDVSRIYNANLQNYVIGSTDDLMFNDGYHPSWDGHDAMSTGWFDTIKNIIDKNALAVAPTPKTPAALGVANNAADYADGFTLIRKLEIPQQVAYALNEAPKYSAITEVADVTKVGYYMELVRDDASDMRYVWVDMDVPAGVTLDKLLVPTGANLQCVVNNLHVKSNMGSVTEVAKDHDGVNGFIEFSPYGAASGAASGVAGAPAETWTAGDKAYNWNDTLATSGNGRGVMQIHRIFDNPATDAHGGEVLFAWNNWGAGNTVEGQKNGEIGIGNFAQHYMADNSNGGIGKKVGLTLASGLSMDYTFLRWDRWGDRMNAKAYTVRNLEIWAKGTVTKHHLMSDEEEVQVEAATEDAALAKAVIDVQDSEADAAANEGADNELGQAQFLTLQATRVGESNNWKVQAVVDNAKLPTNKKIDDTAVAFANAGGIVKLAGATEKQTISIPKANVTPGLYYSVSFGTTPDNHEQESERVLATSGAGTVDIPVPALGTEKVYYIKIKASATTK